MNAFDPLEQELRELSPREATPHFKRRVVENLLEQSSSRQRLRRQPSPMLAVACGLAAATLMAIVLWWRDGEAWRAEPMTTQRLSTAPAELVVRPTVLAYRRVLSESPEKLEGLLQEQSASILPTEPAARSMYAFRRSELERFE
jgi:hypothetical protein